MCVGSVIVYHGLVFVGHGDILVGEGPAGGLHASLGGVGGGVGVEVIGVGEVCSRDGGARRGTELESDVVDIVAAEAFGDASGEYVAEGDVLSGAGVAFKADVAEYGFGVALLVEAMRSATASAWLKSIFPLR